MSAEQYRILLVEDNAADTYLLRKALEKANVSCELTEIDDGEEALAFVRREGKYAEVSAPDLAVLDLNLPKHSGAEVLKAMRQSAFSNTPVVIISSSPARSDRQKLEEFNVARYIIKPPDLEEFLQIGDVLKEILQESSSESR